MSIACCGTVSPRRSQTRSSVSRRGRGPESPGIRVCRLGIAYGNSRRADAGSARNARISGRSQPEQCLNKPRRPVAHPQPDSLLPAATSACVRPDRATCRAGQLSGPCRRRRRAVRGGRRSCTAPASVARQEQRRDHAADHHDGQRPLRLGSRSASTARAGNRPKMAVRAVIITGRTRLSAPCMMRLAQRHGPARASD